MSRARETPLRTGHVDLIAASSQNLSARRCRWLWGRGNSHAQGGNATSRMTS